MEHDKLCAVALRAFERTLKEARREFVADAALCGDDDVSALGVVVCALPIMATGDFFVRRLLALPIANRIEFFVRDGFECFDGF